MENSQINHISDTALWVATYRAEESEKPDAVFRDPLARKLSGERGKKIAASMPSPKMMQAFMAVRTTAIDRLVEKAISQGVDTVINLGAGLDTRPYRMKLPSSLRWIEVDFPHMIEYKNEQLKSEKPVCNLQRISADLSQDQERRQLFARLGSETKKALVITEGVIVYLTSDQAQNLSRDLFAIPTFQYWIQDYRQGGLNQLGAKAFAKKLKSSPFRFDVLDSLGFFKQQGWVIQENILLLDEAERIHRRMPFSFPWSLLLYLIPKKNQEKLKQRFGFVMYARS